MRTFAFEGTKRSWLLSTASVSLAWSPAYSMDWTLPIWIPRYLTLASFSITRPARGAVTVTVSVRVNAAV